MRTGLAQVWATTAREMFLQTLKLRFAKVASSVTVRGCRVSVRNLHWIAQRSPSKVSATRSMPSSVAGRPMRERMAGGSSSLARQTFRSLVWYSGWVFR